jgi:myo-inositol-hexaphosphate 3-phosphohydrolase
MAEPEKGSYESAVFGQGECKEDSEGISIYKFDNGTGYILVSDQSANCFNIYPGKVVFQIPICIKELPACPCKPTKLW